MEESGWNCRKIAQSFSVSIQQVYENFQPIHAGKQEKMRKE